MTNFFKCRDRRGKMALINKDEVIAIRHFAGMRILRNCSPEIIRYMNKFNLCLDGARNLSEVCSTLDSSEKKDLEKHLGTVELDEREEYIIEIHANADLDREEEVVLQTRFGEFLLDLTVEDNPFRPLAKYEDWTIISEELAKMKDLD